MVGLAFVLLELEKSSVLRPRSFILCTAATRAPAMAPPVQAIFMANVAVANVNEIAEDSPCLRVYRQGRYSRVVDSGVHVTDAAIGLRSVRQNQRNVGKNTAAVSLCCCARSPKNKKKVEQKMRIIPASIGHRYSSKKINWTQEYE